MHTSFPPSISKFLDAIDFKEKHYSLYVRKHIKKKKSIVKVLSASKTHYPLSTTNNVLAKQRVNHSKELCRLWAAHPATN